MLTLWRLNSHFSSERPVEAGFYTRSKNEQEMELSHVPSSFHMQAPARGVDIY